MHLIYFFGVMIPLFLLLIVAPLLLVGVKIKEKAILNRNFLLYHPTIRYGLMFVEYSSKNYYFEFFKIFQKILI
jgi:hypothetical protein